MSIITRILILFILIIGCRSIKNPNIIHKLETTEIQNSLYSDSIVFYRDGFSKKYDSLILKYNRDKVIIYGFRDVFIDTASFSHKSEISKVLLNNEICSSQIANKLEINNLSKNERFVFKYFKNGDMKCNLIFKEEKEYKGGSVYDYKIKPKKYMINDSINVYLTMRLMGVKKISDDFDSNSYNFLSLE